MTFALTIGEIILLLAGVAGTGYFVKELTDVMNGKELNKSGFTFIKNVLGENIGMIKYYTGNVTDTISDKATAFNQKTMAAMAAIKNDEGKNVATGQCILYDNGTEKAGAFSVMDKAMAVLTVAGSCGLTMTYDRSKQLLDSLNVAWDKFVIAGTDKIMTILDSDGKSEYIPSELATNIKNALYEADVFSEKVDLTLPAQNVKYVYKIKLEEMARKIIDTSINNKIGFYKIVDNLFTKYDLDDLVIDDKTLIHLTNFTVSGSLGDLSYRFDAYIYNDCDVFEEINYNDMFIKDEKTGLWKRNSYSSNPIYNNFKYGGFKISNYTTSNQRKQSFLRFIYNEKNDTYNLWSASYKNRLMPTNSNNSAYNIICGEYNTSISPVGGYFNFGELKTNVEGVGIQTGALLPTYEEQMDALLERLGQTKGKIKYKVDDKAETATEYIPITRPKVDVETNTGTQADSITDLPTTTADEIVEQVKQIVEDIVITQPYIPEPTFPPINIIDIPNIDPIGDTGFVGIYNPSRLQLRQFTGWLWSDDFLAFLASKMYGSPFDAVISLHAIYCTPVVEGTGNILCGRRNSGISSNLCSQYVTINCGNMKINRYFGTARDYQAKIEIYLPFIGIQMLDTADVLDRTINVMYKIDVLTGTSIAIIKADGQVIAEYEGNCACQIPLSGSSYSSLFGALTGAGAALAAGVGLASAPAVVAGTLAVGSGVAAGMSSNKEPIKKSGSFSANAGALGIKKPFLIITRNVPYEAYDRDKFEGLPCNVTRALVECSGFTKVQEINLNNVTATNEEIDELKSMMTDGIII